MPKGKVAGAAADDDVEEIFTDLHGNVDVIEDGDDAGAADDPMAAAERDAAAGKDGKDDDDDAALPDPDDETEADGKEGEADGADEGGEQSHAVTEPDASAELRQQLKIKDLAIIGERATGYDIQEGYLKNDKARAERTKAEAAKRLKVAKEAGDTDADIAAQQEYLEADKAIDTATAALNDIEGKRQVLRSDLQKLGWNGKGFDETDADRAAKAAAAPKPAKWAGKFAEQNKWLADPQHKASADLLYSIDKTLAAERKIDKDDPKYLAELSRRFNAVKPGLIRGLDGKPVVVTRQRSAVRAGSTVMPGVGTRRAVNPKDVKLDKADIAEMEKYGFDSRNKKHRVNWLREKRALPQEAAGR